MERFLIKIKSITDVITNSSSEVYMFKQDENLVDSVVEDIQDYHIKHIRPDFDSCEAAYEMLTDEQRHRFEEEFDGYSGHGGDVDTYTWEECFENFKTRHTMPNLTEEEWAEKIGRPLSELKSVIILEIDHMCNGTRNYIRDRFNAVSEYSKNFDRELQEKLQYGYV